MDPITLILISIALQVVGYLITPKPKPPAPPEIEDFKAPTSSAGRPIPIVYGDDWITGMNVIDFRNKQTVRRMVKVK